MCSVTKLCPWTVAHQALLSMGFPRQEYRSGLPFPSPGDLPDPGIKPSSPALAGRFFTTEPLGKPCIKMTLSFFSQDEDLLPRKYFEVDFPMIVTRKLHSIK